MVDGGSKEEGEELSSKRGVGIEPWEAQSLLAKPREYEWCVVVKAIDNPPIHPVPLRDLKTIVGY